MSRANGLMNKIKVMENLYLYEFTDKETILPDTITVMIHGDQALLLDTAFPEYAARVKEELKVQGISVTGIILSHYHADHVSGCPVFAPCDIHAGEFYESSYHHCRISEPEYTYLRPHHLLKDGDTLSFGGFNLEFLHVPGHSKCSILTKIGKGLIHVGDLIMKTWNKKNALPFIAEGGDFAEHITSLQLLGKCGPDAVILPHGSLIHGKENIIREIEDRIYYLEQTASSFGTLPLPACLTDDISAYEHLEFHDTNLTRLIG